MNIAILNIATFGLAYVTFDYLYSEIYTFLFYIILSRRIRHVYFWVANQE